MKSILVSKLDHMIADLQARERKETEAIGRYIADRQIDSKGGYWEARHAIRLRLNAALAIRSAVQEVLS